MRASIPNPLTSLGPTALLGLAALLWSAPASADDDPGLPPGFAEVVDVRVVEVEAVVTRGGERVEGLEADDFQLTVDGEPVAIEYFSEVRSGFLAGDPADARTVPSPRLGAAGRSSAVPTYYLVFVDDYFSLPTHRDRALRDLGDQLAYLGPEDRMAIVAYDGREVEMLANWSRDARRLGRALQQATDRPAYGLQRRSEWQQTLARLRSRGARSAASSFAGIGFSGSSVNLPGTDGKIQLDSEIASKVSRVADAAASSLRAFAGPSGRRVMILLSAGLPGLGTFGLPERDGLFHALDRHAAVLDARRLMSPISDAANLLGYTVYPVELGSTADASYGSAESGSLREARFRHLRAQDDDLLRRDSLYFMADETGGRALLRGARSQALKLAAEDTRSYYSLGFAPEWRADDKPREIRLEVKGKGYKVRTRRGFADLSRSTLTSFRVESAHQFDVPLPRARDLRVELGNAEPVGIGKVLVPLTVYVPTEGLALVPTAGGLRAELELRVAATDERGLRAPVDVIPVELLFEDAGAVTAEAPWTTYLRLRKRDHRLLFALYDPVGDALYSRRMELDL